MAKWIETSHTRGWYELKIGGKVVADVKRTRPVRTKKGYRYSFQAVTRFGSNGGLPGSFGPVFATLTAAMATAEAGVCK